MKNKKISLETFGIRESLYNCINNKIKKDII